MKLTLVVLAAGVGSRYGNTKQVEGVGPSGESIMDYSVFDAKRAGFGKVVFVIRPELEKTFREKIAPRYGSKIEVAYAHQTLGDAPEDRQKPWGTGHALLSAKGEVDSPFALINADDYYGHNSFQIVASHLSSSQAGTYAMVGYHLTQTLSRHGFVSRGVCETDPKGGLKSVVERVHVERTLKGIECKGDSEKPFLLNENDIVSMNFWGFDPSIFAHLQKAFGEFLQKHGKSPREEFFLPAVIDELICKAKTEVKILPTEDTWFGLTYPEDKKNAVERIASLIQSGIYPSKLW